jgi:polysaccharide biosynthesis protein PslG
MDGPEPGAGAPRWRWRSRAGAAVVAVAAGAALALVLILSSGGGHRPAAPAGPAPTASAPSGTSPVPAPPAKPAPGAEEFGVSVNRLFNDGTYSPQQIDSQLTALRATGATIARSDALWEASEPAAPVGGVHHYDWGFDDAIATALARHDLRWLPIIDYSAPWAESVAGVEHAPPSTAADFAAYAAAFAARYGSGGSFWSAHPDLTVLPVGTFEIWNEPDSPHFWSPVPDAASSAALYTAARDAIAAADPEARVIVGGLSNPGAFLPALLAAAPDLRGHIDGVGIHPYAPNPLSVLATVGRARTTLAALGLGSVPLYVTEFGWPTLPAHSQDWAPERLRPRYIRSTIAALGHTNCGVAMTVLYTWVTPERDPANREDWFGIHSPAGTATPDVRALTAGLRAAAASSPTFDVCHG